MLYKYFQPRLTHVTALPCVVKLRCSKNCYITLKCIICNKLSDD